MIERIYLEDWAYNAGIVGFINILENSNKDFVITKKFAWQYHKQTFHYFIY